MSDLLLFTPKKKAHMAKLEGLLKALLKNGLKISPKKCQLFRKELQYMKNTIFIKDRRVCVKLLRSRLEAIQKLKSPMTVKGCRSFVGMVNFLSIFCPELQKLLKLHLYSDTSKFTTGSALYQIQNGKPKLIALASKRLPESGQNYSIVELEMCSLAINIASFANLLKKVDFDAIIDHLALTHIIKSKVEPATTRIKRLLEILSSYSFNLHYIKGKDMNLSGFLSRQKHETATHMKLYLFHSTCKASYTPDTTI